MKSKRKLHNRPVPHFRLWACASGGSSSGRRVSCGGVWRHVASMPPLDLALCIRELADRSPQRSELDATQHGFALCRIQTAYGQGQERHAGVDEVVVGVVKLNGLDGVHQTTDEAGAHALASECMTVL